MKFLAIDIETTGLESGKHAMIQFAAVYADLRNPDAPLKQFYRWLHPQNMVWDAFCLTMHYDWIKEITTRVKEKNVQAEPMYCLTTTQLVNSFATWLFTQCEHPVPYFDENGVAKWGKLTAAGKNFASFDLQFLKEAGFPECFRHRSLDPTLYFIQPEDTIPPELKLCKERAIAEGCTWIVPGVAHNALEDAIDVARLLQWGYMRRYH